MRLKGFHVFRSRYRKHFPPFPTSLCTEYSASYLSEKEYGLRFKSNIQAYDEDKMYVVIGYKEDFKKFGEYFLRRFLREPSYLLRLVCWSEKNKNSLKNYLEKNFSGNLSKLSSNELWRKYNGYLNKYRHFHLKNTPAWWLGADPVVNELKKELSRLKNWEEIFEIITTPLEYKTENFLEEESLLKIAIAAKKLGIRKIGKNINPKIKKKLAKHVDEFGYIPFGYNVGTYWQENYFIPKINSLLTGDLSRELKKIRDNIQAKIERRELVIKKFRLNKKEIILAKSLRMVAYLQELKKATQTKSHPLLNQVVYREFSKRLNVPIRMFDYLSYPEIKESLQNGQVSKELKQEVKKRLGVSAIIMQNLKFKWIYDNDVKKFLKANNLVANTENIKELQGVSASRGYAKGKTSICAFSTECKKIKQGEILVAGMTTPDFVPAMKKAVAIITDEGGITSHAAIVSREMGKPCIIGTKIATKVLKDGDLVEVDADKGVVKIIKKG